MVCVGWWFLLYLHACMHEEKIFCGDLKWLRKKEKEKTHFPSQHYQNESDQKCLSQKLYTSLLIFMQKWLTPVHFHMREKLQVLYSLNLINISLLIFKLLRRCFAFLFVLKKITIRTHLHNTVRFQNYIQKIIV